MLIHNILGRDISQNLFDPLLICRIKRIRERRIVEVKLSKLLAVYFYINYH